MTPVTTGLRKTMSVIAGAPPHTKTAIVVSGLTWVQMSGVVSGLAGMKLPDETVYIDPPEDGAIPEFRCYERHGMTILIEKPTADSEVACHDPDGIKEGMTVYHPNPFTPHKSWYVLKVVCAGDGWAAESEGLYIPLDFWTPPETWYAGAKPEWIGVGVCTKEALKTLERFRFHEEEP